jgi:hypothetical protein
MLLIVIAVVQQYRKHGQGHPCLPRYLFYPNYLSTNKTIVVSTFEAYIIYVYCSCLTNDSSFIKFKSWIAICRVPYDSDEY